MEPIELMTVKEVAEFLRVSNMTVFREIKAKKMPAFRIGRQYRIRKTDLERYLQR